MLIDGSDHHLLVRMLVEFLEYLAVSDLWILAVKSTFHFILVVGRGEFMPSALCRFDVELSLLWGEATGAAESISFFVGGQNQVDRAHVAFFLRSST